MLTFHNYLQFYQYFMSTFFANFTLQKISILNCRVKWEKLLMGLLYYKASLKMLMMINRDFFLMTNHGVTLQLQSWIFCSRSWVQFLTSLIQISQGEYQSYLPILLELMIISLRCFSLIKLISSAARGGVMGHLHPLNQNCHVIDRLAFYKVKS